MRKEGLGMGEEDKSPGIDFAEQIRRQFEDDDRPATWRDVADVYRVLAANQDIATSFNRVVTKLDPSIILAPAWQDMQTQIRAHADLISTALLKLNGDREISDE